MKNAKNTYGTVNRWAFYGALTGFISYATWPGAASAFPDWMFPGAMAGLAAGGVLRTARGYYEDYSLRRLMMSALHPSDRHGNARFADLPERLMNNLHDPKGRVFLGLCDGLPTFLPEGNLLVEAMQGSGKTSRIIALSIFHAAMTGRSVFAADPKGELYFLLAPVLRSMGFRVRVTNFGAIPGIPHDDFNPFQSLVDAVHDEARHHEVFSLAEAIALIFIEDKEGDKNAFFTAMDRANLVAVLVGLAVLRPFDCYPAGVWRTLADPSRFRKLLRDGSKSEALSGDLATITTALLEKDATNEEHAESSRTGAANSLSVFKPSSSLGSLGSSHSYRPEEARDPGLPPMVVFDVTRTDQLEVYSKPSELVTTIRLLDLLRHSSGRQVVFSLEEMTSNPAQIIPRKIEIMRSFGIFSDGSYQSVHSLEKVYGKERAASLKANCAQLYFSVSSLSAAKEISERIGDRTIKTESLGFGENRKPSRNIGETGRRLVSPEELLSMGRDEAILLMPRMRPVKIRTVPWYEIDPAKNIFGDNPHEQHAGSTVTRLSMLYGKDVSELGPPSIPKLEEQLARASRRQDATKKPGRVALFRPFKLLWVPTVLAFLTFVLTIGTPHLAWTQANRASGGWHCFYLGIGGIQIITSEHGCPLIGWLPPHAAGSS